MFQLHISENSETLSLKTRTFDSTFEIELFGITIAFLQAFKPLYDDFLRSDPTQFQSIDRINKTLDSVNKQIAFPLGLFRLRYNHYWPRSSSYWERSFYRLTDRYGRLFWLFTELVCLHDAVSDWLTPQKISPKSRKYFSTSEAFLNQHQKTRAHFSDSPIDFMSMDKDNDQTLRDSHNQIYSALFEDLGGENHDQEYSLLSRLFREEVFRYRTRQVGTELVIIYDKQGNPILSHLYSSKDILSLAWAEIMWAIDQKKYAHFCDICGGVFKISCSYGRKSFTCSKPCEKQNRINRMGGPDALKKYNTIAQANHRARKKRL